MNAKGYILAPLRGVTVRTFRRVFAPVLREAGFVGAVSPFIPALSPKINVKSLRDVLPAAEPLPCVPQAIGKDPVALRALLVELRRLGHVKADLNAGCPYPMITRKGRGAGLLRHPDVLERMLAVGVETMGEGNFSLKVRLGVEASDELLKLMPLLNRFPLANLTVHARTARQMYQGGVDMAAFAQVLAASVNPVVYNGDFDPAAPASWPTPQVMVGRAFLRNLALRDDSRELAQAYLAATEEELEGRSSVLGRMKELLDYWSAATPAWQRRWQRIKLCRTIAELKLSL